MTIKIENISSDFENIEVQQYAPFAVKKYMISSIIDAIASENENGITVFDYSLLPMFKDMMIISRYTNIDVPEENIVESYDTLKEKGVIDYVLSKMSNNEKSFFSDTLRLEIKQLKETNNSLANVLVKSLNKIIEKLPDEKGMAKLLKSIPKELNKISPETFGALKNIVR